MTAEFDRRAAREATFAAQAGFEHIVAIAGLGPRVAGSPEEDAAADYVAERLRSFGLSVTTPEFDIRHWYQRAAGMQTGSRTIECTAVAFTGSDPTYDRVVDTVFIDRATPFDLANAGDVRGKALLVARDVYVDYPDTELFERLAPFAPAAVIFTASPGHKGVPVVFYNFKEAPRVPAPPCFVISHADMTALLAKEPNRLALTFEAEVSDRLSRNVVGVLEGRRRDEIVVVCAHHDSVPGSPGATDNAGGCAVVIELARAFATGPRPERTMHFCSWGAHETGMHGSEAYIVAMRAMQANVVAAVNFDCIGMAIGDDQIDVLGGPGWNAMLDGVIEATGIQPTLRKGPGYTDFTNFGAAGIPSASVWQSHLNANHTRFDAVDLCSPRGLVKPLLLGRALADAAVTSPEFRSDFSGRLQAEVRAFNARWGWSQFG